MTDAATKVQGLLLAAGRGQRFGAEPKLLRPLADGRPLVLHALQRLRDALQAPPLVVLRAGDEPLAALLREQGAAVVVTADAERGMGASLAAGARAVADDAAILVALGDMPAIAPSTYAAVLRTLRCGAAIVQPRCKGLPGHPVGFAANWLPQLRALDGDTGARPLLRAYAARVTALPVDDAGCLLDVDTPQDLARL
jgi:molybdenum cofactor cytidylyltransferase